MTNQQTPPSAYSCSSSIDRHQGSSLQEDNNGSSRPSSPWLPINIERMRGNQGGSNIGRYSPPPLPQVVVDPTSYFSRQQHSPRRPGSGCCSTRDLQVIIDEVLSIVEEDNDDDFLQ